MKHIIELLDIFLNLALALCSPTQGHIGIIHRVCISQLLFIFFLNRKKYFTYSLLTESNRGIFPYR